MGKSYRMADYYEVGREKVREFATAVQDDHPSHFSEEAAARLGHDGLLAPLTFVSIIGVLGHFEMYKAWGLSEDLKSTMQTDQRFIYHKPIVAGDRLTAEINVESYREMAGNNVVVTKNFIWNQDGELVQTNYTTLISRPDMDLDGVV